MPMAEASQKRMLCNNYNFADTHFSILYATILNSLLDNWLQILEHFVLTATKYD